MKNQSCHESKQFNYFNFLFIYIFYMEVETKVKDKMMWEINESKIIATNQDYFDER